MCANYRAVLKPGLDVLFIDIMCLYIHDCACIVYIRNYYTQAFVDFIIALCMYNYTDLVPRPIEGEGENVLL